jgi:rfaE bifunctional protein kinase chain/domain
MNLDNLEDIFNRFNDLRILVIGDVMIDSYIWGKVERISPEAPVPVVTVTKRESRLGGAANVALNIQALGATPVLCSVIGDDPESDLLLELLREKNIHSDALIKSDQRPTSVKQRIISGSQHIVRIDSESDSYLSPEEKILLIKKIRNLISVVDAVIFEDYDKGVLDEEVISVTVDEAKRLGIPTIVDPKKRNFLHYRGVTVFKPNLKELKEGLKIDFSVNDKKSFEAAVSSLRSKLHHNTTLLTLSEKGVFIASETENHYIPAHLRNISDISGAGDTVVSIASLCTALRLPNSFTAKLANLGGGIVCEYLGVVPVPKDRLYEEAHKNQIYLDS